MVKKLTTPFANDSDLKTEIPQTTTQTGKASFSKGFPPETMKKISEGGVAPDGKDFNGILNEITQQLVDINKGLVLQKYDDTYSQNIGGYPLNARILLDDGRTVVVSTKEQNQTNPNLSLEGWHLFSDDNLMTWSGRTQREKNRDTLSVEDFGVKTSNSAQQNNDAFFELESQEQGRDIDLNGYNYYVLGNFSKNNYYNGNLIVSPTEIYPKQKGGVGEIHFQAGAGNGQKLYQLITPNYDASQGTGSSIFQGACYSTRDSLLYTSRVIGRDSSGKEMAVIERFSLATGYDSTAQIISKPSTGLGHQSLGISYSGANKVFWSVAGADKDGNKSQFVSKISFDETTLDLTPTFVQVVDDDEVHQGAKDMIGAMCVSADGNFLATIYVDKNNLLCCKVFRVLDLIDTENCSNKYLYKFNFNRELYTDSNGTVTFYIQDMAMCGDNIYFLHSRAGDPYRNCTIAIYNTNGRELLTERKNILGVGDALAIKNAGGTWYREPEAIFFLPSLNGGWDFIMMQALGRKTATEGKTAPHNNILVSSRYTAQLRIKSAGNTPALNLISNNSIAVPESKGFNVVQADNLGNFKPLFDISKVGVANFQNTVQLTYTDTSQPQLKLANSKGSMLLQVSASGNAGLYTSSSYAIAVNTSDQAFFQKACLFTNKKINMGGIQIFTDNSSAKSGGLAVGDVYRTSTGQLMIVY